MNSSAAVITSGRFGRMLPLSSTAMPDRDRNVGIGKLRDLLAAFRFRKL